MMLPNLLQAVVLGLLSSAARSLPANAATSLHMEVLDGQARGYDRSSSTHFSASVSGRLVQLYDHSQGEWFAYDVQDA
jgi:hypothetical protein